MACGPLRSFLGAVGPRLTRGYFTATPIDAVQVHRGIGAGFRRYSGQACRPPTEPANARAGLAPGFHVYVARAPGGSDHEDVLLVRREGARPTVRCLPLPLSLPDSGAARFIGSVMSFRRAISWCWPALSVC